MRVAEKCEPRFVFYHNLARDHDLQSKNTI